MRQLDRGWFPPATLSPPSPPHTRISSGLLWGYLGLDSNINDGRMWYSRCHGPTACARSDPDALQDMPEMPQRPKFKSRLEAKTYLGKSCVPYFRHLSPQKT